ncbi:hypothetical protein AWB75_04635 [Caballeronia catudaia]|uniref:Uncharacterized protein n=1 Tax=Caballeronia catudaia TaxID=1777136 RepID=A0A158C773_9BURK|nr:hypothetical protein AWB75_04635 [Caballeronia catudaia]
MVRGPCVQIGSLKVVHDAWRAALVGLSGCVCLQVAYARTHEATNTFFRSIETKNLATIEGLSPRFTTH